MNRLTATAISVPSNAAPATNSRAVFTPRARNTGAIATDEASANQRIDRLTARVLFLEEQAANKSIGKESDGNDPEQSVGHRNISPT